MYNKVNQKSLSNQGKINIPCGLVWKSFITKLVGPLKYPRRHQALLKGPLHGISEPIKNLLTPHIKHYLKIFLKVELSWTAVKLTTFLRYWNSFFSSCSIVFSYFGDIFFSGPKCSQVVLKSLTWQMLTLPSLTDNTDFPGGSVVKNPLANEEDMVSVPESGRSIPWRREWLPTPVFLPGKFHGQRSLGGYSPWGCERVDLTERPNNNKWITQLCKKVSVLLLLLQSGKLSTEEN